MAATLWLFLGREVIAQGFELDGTEGDDDRYDAGHPVITVTAVTDRLRGFGGDDLIAGFGGDDVLEGGDGNDELQGGEGDDTLDGGAGADRLFGGAGNDSYLFDNADTVADAEGQNTIRFGAGVAPEDLRVSAVTVGGAPRLLISRPGSPEGGPGLALLETTLGDTRFDYAFADGTRLTQEQLLRIAYTAPQTLTGTDAADSLAGYGGDDTLSGAGGDDTLFGHHGDDGLDGGDGADLLEGGAGADTLQGGAGDDLLEGGAGDDILEGGIGADTYTFARGDGHDTVADGGAEGAGDTLRFAPDILRGDVRLVRQANGDLAVTLNGTDEGVTVSDWYTNPQNRIERIVFGDGEEISEAELAALEVAPIAGSASADALTGTAYNDTLLGLAGDDRLDGGLGDDLLDGGSGQDAYVLGWGVGRDTVIEAPGETSTIELAPAMTFGDLTASRAGDDLFLGTRGTGDGLLLKDYFIQSGTWQLVTANGETRSLADFLTALPPVTGDLVQDAWQETKTQFMAQWYADGERWNYGTLLSDGTFYDPGRIVSVNFSGFYLNGDASSFHAGYVNAAWPTEISRRLSVNAASSDEANQDWAAYDSSFSETPATFRVAWERPAVSWNTYFLGTVPDYSGTVLTEVFRTDVSGQARGVVQDISPVTEGGLPGAVEVARSAATLGPLPFEVSGLLRTQSETHILNEIRGGPSDNYILSELGYVDGGAGNDTIEGWGNYGPGVVNNFLAGGPGNDVIRGYWSTDVLAGGEGDDDLHGTFGADTYLVDPRDAGNDQINEVYSPYWGAINGDPAEFTDTVRFGEGLRPDGLRFAWGSVTFNSSWDGVRRFTTLDLSWDAGQGIRVVLSDASVAERPGAGIETFQFSAPDASGQDGPVLSTDQLLDLAKSRIGPVPTIVGTAGADVINGTEGDDLIHGLGGTDTIWALGGSDTLDGGPGDDILLGGTGNDVYLFGRGSGQDTIRDIDFTPANVDTVRFSADVSPADVVVWRDVFDLHLSIDESADRVTLGGYFGRSSARVEQVTFSDGTVWDTATIAADAPFGVLGTENADSLLGSSSNNVIFGLGGNDYLSGAGGNDVLKGGAGDDTYLFNLGDGVDRIQDGGGVDTLQFGAGITPDMLSLGVGSLLVRVGNNGDAIHIDDFNPADVHAHPVIEHFQFADGTSLSYEQLLERGFAISGTDGADTLTGTDISDRIAGGPGDDVLAGGEGDDTYVFNPGDGVDTIRDASLVGAPNRIRFGAGIRRDDLSPSIDGNALRIDVGSGGDAVVLEGFDQSVANGTTVVGILEFDDGSTIPIAELLNRAPELVARLPDVEAPEDAPFRFQIPAGAFIDRDAGDVLAFEASLADGSALPSWLAFDPAAREFSGTPANDDVGVLSISVTATDRAGERVSDTFELCVPNVNDAPEQIRPLDDAAVADGEAFMYMVPADAFRDVDAGDSLRLSATLASGASLSGWLTFDPATGTFSGTPSEQDLGAMMVAVHATDGAGASVTGEFGVSIAVAPDRSLAGTAGDDLLEGRSGDDSLDGADGNDRLFGRMGDDTLSGGAGNDLLAGGRGDDRYRFAPGDGLDLLSDPEGRDTVEFAVGIAPGQVVARAGAEGARVRLLDERGNERDEGMDLLFSEPGISPVERFEFAGGTSLTLADLLIQSPTHYGTDKADEIITGRDDDTVFSGKGTDRVRSGSGHDLLYGEDGNDSLDGEAGHDRLDGGKGADDLFGGDGDDVLEGGAGSDRLDGGSGFNTYVFAQGFGEDRILPGTGSGVVRFEDGIASGEVRVKRDGRALVLQYLGEAEDKVRIEDWFADRTRRPLEAVAFADGTTWSAQALDVMAKGPGKDAAPKPLAASPFGYDRRDYRSEWARTHALLDLHLEGSGGSEGVSADLAVFRPFGSVHSGARDPREPGADDGRHLHALTGLKEGLNTLG